MKNSKKITAVILSAVLLGTTCAPIYAGTAQDEKQEVVYVMTDASGKVNDIEVVNIFDGGDIKDYGDYSEVKVLNTTDKIRQDGEKISISSSAEKVYYQGTPKTKEIPWNISIRYFLDGKEYSASELAGKNGELKIYFSVSKNTAYTGTFYEDYALQANFTMDAEKCTDITADGANLANVGNDKQISYTILPGKGIDTVITANVTDFEMPAVAVNGIQLNLDVDIDEDELKDKVSEFLDAVKKLNEGAEDLYDGSGKLKTATSDLKTGTSALHSGSEALDEGMMKLQSGLNEVQKGLDSLNSRSGMLTENSLKFKTALKKIQAGVNSVSASEKDLSALMTSSGKIKKAIGDLDKGATALRENLGYAQYKGLMAQNGIDIDALKAQNAKAMETIEKYEALLGKDSAELEQMKALFTANNGALVGMESYLNGVSAELPALTDGLSALHTQYEAFDNAIGKLVTGLGSMTGNMSALADGINQLVDNYEKLDAGIGAYTDGVAQVVAGYSQVMDGVSALAEGSKELVSGSGELYDGTIKMYDGVASLCDGAKTMAKGTDKFYSKTSETKEKLTEEIDGILDSIGGDTKNPVSFVSSKNTNVDSVQFVIKTTAIEKNEAEAAEPAPQEKLNFLQKLLKLFRRK